MVVYTFAVSITNQLPYVQWQSAPAAVGPWTSIAGETALSYSVTPTTFDTLYFRVGNGYSTTVGDHTWTFSAAMQVNVGIPYNVGAVMQGATADMTFGKPFTLTAIVTSLPAGTKVYQWEKSVIGSGVWNTITGATATTLTFTNPQIADNADYRLTYKIGANPIVNLNTIRLLVLPSITTQPAATTTIATGATYTAMVTPATGQTGLSYIWEYSPVVTNPQASDWSVVQGEIYDTIRIPRANTTNSGLYRVTIINSLGNATTSANARLTVNPPNGKPIITTQPVALAKANTKAQIAGQTAIFKVVASGFPAPTYQWKRSTDGGATYSNFTQGKASSTTGATTAQLSIGFVLPDDAGLFKVVATNSQGSVESNAVQLDVLHAPYLTVQPLSQVLNTGANCTLTVTAVANQMLAAPTYQWSKDGAPLVDGGAIAGAATNTLTITGIVLADAGSYVCTVTNAHGAVDSEAAILTVNLAPQAGGTSAPQVLSQPVSVEGPTGSSFSFIASVIGNPTPTLQWQKYNTGTTSWDNLVDGATVSGATQMRLTITDVGGASAGTYRLVATNAVGTVNSSEVTIATSADLWANTTINDGWSTFDDDPDGFGPFYYDPETDNVIFHPNHGWLLVVSSGAADTGAWYWAADLGWFYTTVGTGDLYPYIFVLEVGDWYYYVVGSSNPRYFFDYSTDTWITMNP